jgi:hypothetical protein
MVFRGCTSINGTVYTRGRCKVSAAWAATGNQGGPDESVLRALPSLEKQAGRSAPVQNVDAYAAAQSPIICKISGAAGTPITL